MYSYLSRPVSGTSFELGYFFIFNKHLLSAVSRSNLCNYEINRLCGILMVYCGICLHSFVFRHKILRKSNCFLPQLAISNSATRSVPI